MNTHIQCFLPSNYILPLFFLGRYIFQVTMNTKRGCNKNGYVRQHSFLILSLSTAVAHVLLICMVKYNQDILNLLFKYHQRGPKEIKTCSSTLFHLFFNLLAVMQKGYQFLSIGGMKTVVECVCGKLLSNGKRKTERKKDKNKEMER